jgi:hypothetical protein
MKSSRSWAPVGAGEIAFLFGAEPPADDRPGHGGERKHHAPDRGRSRHQEATPDGTLMLHGGAEREMPVDPAFRLSTNLLRPNAVGKDGRMPAPMASGFDFADYRSMGWGPGALLPRQ